MNGFLGAAIRQKTGRPIGLLGSSPTVDTDGPLGAALKRIEVLRAAADAARAQGDFDVADAALAKVDAQLADLEAGRVRDAAGRFVGTDGQAISFDNGFQGRRPPPGPSGMRRAPSSRELFSMAMSASHQERRERAARGEQTLVANI